MQRQSSAVRERRAGDSRVGGSCGLAHGSDWPLARRGRALVGVGPYEVVRVLGSGAFAHTFEARHAILGTTACLKVGRLRRHNGLLVREARVLWDLHHPSIPSLREIFLLPDGCVAIAMRFVEGASLQALSPLDIPTAIRVLDRLLRVLRMIHQRGIVHNDVKPANIIVEPDRQGVVLVDFGLCQSVLSRDPRAHGMTPAYAAPEVVAGHAPQPTSDLYSLGLSILSALGGDVHRKMPPRGAPECLLSLLRGLTHREPSQRLRWEGDDPLRRLEDVRSKLA